MDRIKTYDSTGISPNGKLFAGDLNLLQDTVAALVSYTQTMGVSTIGIGDSGLTISKFGTGEMLFSGIVRATNIVKGLGGLFAGAYTTTARNAISSPPFTLIIFNTTTNQFEWNAGTSGSPAWQAISATIGASSITRSMLAAELKPSGTAATTDEALRALGATADTACSGNDSRLSNTRTPTNNSITFAMLTAAAVAAIGSGHFVGEPIDWLSLNLPTYGAETWAWNDGSAISRTTYAGALAVIAPVYSGTRSSGTKPVTGLASTAGMKVGQAVEGAGFASGTTIQSVDSSSQITLSNNASSSGTGTIQVFPWGNGDGSTTFNLPDKRGRTWMGIARSGGHIDMSGMGGNEGASVTVRRALHKHTLASALLPTHVHTSGSLDGSIDDTSILEIGPGDNVRNSGGGVGNAITNQHVTISGQTGGVTSNPAISGFVGSNTNDVADAVPYGVCGSITRIL